MQEMKVKKKKLTSLDIYYISKWLEYLQLAISKKWPVVYKDRSIYKSGNTLLLGILISLREWLKILSLCQNEINTFENLIKEFEEYYTNPKNSLKLTDFHAKKLYKIVTKIETVLLKELENKILIEISFSGKLNYRGILKDGLSVLFSNGKILNKLPSLIKNDIKEAVKALICGIPTASAMISLRAVEGIIRDLYKALKGKECKKKWNEVLNEVEGELKNRKLEFKKLEGYLHHIRKIRNEAEHPERVFTTKESENILMLAIYAIEEIYKTIEEIKPRANI